MKFTISRDQLLKALQKIHTLLVKQDTHSILENVLLETNKDTLFLTAINLEIEIIIKIPILTLYQIGSTTVAGKKLFNICRRLSKNIIITIQSYEKNLTIITKNSFFSLMTLSEKNFPSICNFKTKIQFNISPHILKIMLHATYFSMANHDVRYYLNGMLLEIDQNNIRAIATDGYRIAIYNMPINLSILPYSIIIPRKTIIELMRLLDNSDELSNILIGLNSIRIKMENMTITSKLIEGSFPDYRLILIHHPIKIIEVNINILKESLLRVAILSNEKFHAVHFLLKKNQLEISTNNKNEQAKEIINLKYSSNMNIEIDININYILDVLNVLHHETIMFFIDKTISKIQLQETENSLISYIIMPLRL
ncbi:MAG TPA: DNA polymerase III subunit beta [Buchnera sp. (in: enterobacteria)]|nr:DNA polymerase III subunit beta [Buchnera sp. (in: enterobacteria)]